MHGKNRPIFMIIYFNLRETIIAHIPHCISVTLVPLMILTPTIEPGIEYKNKNVTKDMPSLFETYFWERIKNTEPRTKNSPFL